MPIPFRSDLQAFLTEFIDDPRGVRLGKMFGLPAGYVGRRLFVCVMEDEVAARNVAERQVEDITGVRLKGRTR